MIQATINGEKRELDDHQTIAAFLASRNVNERIVVVEYNGDILAREKFATTEIGEGDNLEIVQMMAGG
jgi:sulfur carrier protein